MVEWRLLIVLLSLLAGAMVIWFFYYRRRMLRLMVDMVKALEDTFKPVDKNYYLLGYLVGFRAIYDLPRSSPFRKAYILLTLIPRHSLLYYPIARFVTMRFDRLEVAVEPRARVEENFYLRRLSYMGLGLGRAPDTTSFPVRERVRTINGSFEIYYSNPTLKKIVHYISSSNVKIYRVITSREGQLISILTEANPKTVKEVYDILVKVSDITC